MHGNSHVHDYTCTWLQSCAIQVSTIAQTSPLKAAKVGIPRRAADAMEAGWSAEVEKEAIP